MHQHFSGLERFLLEFLWWIMVAANYRANGHSLQLPSIQHHQPWHAINVHGGLLLETACVIMFLTARKIFHISPYFISFFLILSNCMAGLSVLPEMDVTQFVHKHSTLNKNQIILISPLIFLFFFVTIISQLGHCFCYLKKQSLIENHLLFSLKLSSTESQSYIRIFFSILFPYGIILYSQGAVSLKFSSFIAVSLMIVCKYCRLSLSTFPFQFG